MLNTEAGKDIVYVDTCGSSTTCTTPTSTVSYSGTNIPLVATYPSAVIRIRFVSDRTNQRDGFVAVYSVGTFLPCVNGANTAVQAPMAVIWDGDGMYSNDAVCSWTSALQSPKIEFVQLDTQAGLDFVYVEECPAAP